MRNRLRDARLQQLAEPPSTFMGILFAPPLVTYIDQLVRLGLHGNDRAEVCVELIRQGVARAVSDRLLTVPKPKPVKPRKR